MALPNVVVIGMDQFETPALLTAKGNRRPVEYFWTCASNLTFQILEFNCDLENLTYLDADMMFYGSPEPVFEEIGSASVAITPHRYSPNVMPSSDAFSAGKYNVGFVYFLRDGPGGDCLEKWARDCRDWCYWEHKQIDGRWQYGDQQYLDYWEEDFPGRVHSIQHKGANLAPWNQRQYSYSFREDALFVEDDPLLWFHFHKGLNPGYDTAEEVQSFV
ncbi:unnamed protein product, partial [marine sediment metagenome]